jgi:hypothetical protein
MTRSWAQTNTAAEHYDIGLHDRQTEPKASMAPSAGDVRTAQMAGTALRVSPD